MGEINEDALRFLRSRRSRPWRTLTAPAPERAALVPILEAALRVPDHGKLEPWRLIVLEGGALQRLADAARARGAELALDPDKVEKMAAQFVGAPMVVTVVGVPRSVEKIPAIEQTLSAGAVCLSLLNAALASGWGANWLTGWAAHDREFVERHLGLGAAEWVAGYVLIGTETSAPPERDRPDLAAVTTWTDT